MWHKKLGGSMQLSKYGLVLLCVSFGCFASEQPIVDQNIKSRALALLTDGLSEALEECSENQARLIVDLDTQVRVYGKIYLHERQKWMMTHMPHDLKEVVKIKYHLNDGIDKKNKCKTFYKDHKKMIFSAGTVTALGVVGFAIEQVLFR